VGFLDNFEKGLERFVNGAFSKTFKSELQPVEIASAIKSEMDSKASILSRERILAPNTFRVGLSVADFRRMQSLGDALISELTDLATKHAKKQGYQFGAAVSIVVSENPTLNLGQINVTSQTQEHAVEWVATLAAGEQRFVLGRGETTIGRDASASIQINDAGLSRKHFSIIWDGKNAMVRDLQSTNGTKVNGRPVSEIGIATDSIITAGRSQFVFGVAARSLDSGIQSAPATHETPGAAQ